MLKLVILGGLVLLILIVAVATRLMPHGTAAETTTAYSYVGYGYPCAWQRSWDGYWYRTSPCSW